MPRLEGNTLPIVAENKAPPKEVKHAKYFVHKMRQLPSPFATEGALEIADDVAKMFVHNQLEIDAEIAQPQAERDPATFVVPPINYADLDPWFRERLETTPKVLLAKFIKYLSSIGDSTRRGMVNDYFRARVLHMEDPDALKEIILNMDRFSCSISDRNIPITDDDVYLYPYEGVDYGHGFNTREESIRLRSRNRFEGDTTICHHEGCQVRVFKNDYTRDRRSSDRGFYCQNHHPRVPRHDNGHTFYSYHSSRERTVFHNGSDESDKDFVGLEIEFTGDRVTAANQVTDIDPDKVMFRCENDATCSGEIISNPVNPTAYRKEFSRVLFKLTRKLRKSGLRAWNLPESAEHECGLHFHMNRKALRPLHIFKLFKLFYEGDNLKHWFALSGRREMGYYYCNFNIPDDKKARRRVLKELGKFRAPNDPLYTADRSRPLNFNREINTIECRIMRGSFATGHLNATMELGYAMMEFVRDQEIPLNCMSFGHFVRYAVKRVDKYPHLVRMFKRRDVLNVIPFVEPPTDEPYMPMPIFWKNAMGQQLKWDYDRIRDFIDTAMHTDHMRDNMWFVNHTKTDNEFYTVEPFHLFRRRASLQADGTYPMTDYDNGEIRRLVNGSTIVPVLPNVMAANMSRVQHWMLTHEWNGLKPGTILMASRMDAERIELTDLGIIRAKVAGSVHCDKFMCPLLYAVPLLHGAIKELKSNDIRPEQTRFERMTLFKHMYKRREALAGRMKALVYMKGR